MLSTKITDSEQVIVCRDPDIKTVDELIAHCEIDLTVWKIKEATVNKWGGFARTKSYRDPNNPHVHRRQLSKLNLYQVKLRLEKISQDEKDVKKLREDLIADMNRHSPKVYKRIPAARMTRDGLMVEMSLPDPHFGKLAWYRETGESYDLHIANDRYMFAVKDLIAKVRAYPITKILFPIGNDLLHADNHLNQTFGGTPQDVDGRWAKSFLFAKRAIIDALDLCREIAPVNVIVVPGNHDRERAFYVGDTIQSHYRLDNQVQVDNGPILRKYVEWGKNLLGFTHGSEEKKKDLPLLMAQEAAEAWARTNDGTREWHLGHEHKQEETRFNVADTFQGVVVRVLPSLCSTDAWHFSRGYVKNAKQAEAYLWDFKLGYAGHLVHRPDPSTIRPTKTA